MFYAESSEYDKQINYNVSRNGNRISISKKFTFNASKIANLPSVTGEESLLTSLQTMKKIMVLKQDEWSACLGSFLVVDHALTTLYTPFFPSLHGIQYVFIRSGQSWKYTQDLSLIPNELQLWLNHVYIYESEISNSPFFILESGKYTGGRPGLDWWKNVGEIPENFITFLSRSNIAGEIDYDVIKPNLFIELIEKYVIFEEEEKKKKITDDTNNYISSVENSIKNNEFVKAANDMGVTKLGAAFNKVEEEVIKKWNPDELKSQRAYINKISDLMLIKHHNELILGSPTENLAVESAQMLGSKTSPGIQRNLISFLISRMRNYFATSDFVKAVDHYNNIPMTPLLTLAQLKNESMKKIEEEIEGYQKESENLKSMKEKIKYDKVTLSDTTKVLKAFEDIRNFMENRDNAVVQAARDVASEQPRTWMLQAIAKPYKDYYKDSYPLEELEKYRKIADFAQASVGQTGGEYDEPILDVVKKRLANKLPTSFWDLDQTKINEMNLLIVETYQAFSKNLRDIKYPFEVTWLIPRDPGGMYPGWVRQVDHSLYHSQVEIENERDEAKNYKRYMMSDKTPHVEIKKMAQQPGVYTDDKGMDAVNAAMKTFYDQFNKLKQSYDKVVANLKRDRDDHTAVVRNKLTELEASVYKLEDVIKKLPGKSKREKWASIDYFLNLPESDYTTRLSDRLRETLKTFKKFTDKASRTRFVDMLKTWTVSNDPSDATDVGTALKINEKIKEETTDKLMGIYKSAIKPLLKERVTECSQRFSHRVRGVPQPWEAIKFTLATNPQEIHYVPKSTMMHYDARYVDRIGDMYTVFESNFEKEFPTFMLNGYSETFAFSEETSKAATVENSRVMALFNDTDNTLEKYMVDYTIRELGLFQSHIFHDEIKNNKAYILHILSTCLRDFLPRLFVILSGISLSNPSQHETETGKIEKPNVLIALHSLFKDVDREYLVATTGVRITKNYVKNTSDKELIYEKISIKDKKIKLPTLIDMMTTDVFYTAYQEPVVSQSTAPKVLSLSSGVIRALRPSIAKDLLKVKDRADNKYTIGGLCQQPMESVKFVKEYFPTTLRGDAEAILTANQLSWEPYNATMPDWTPDIFDFDLDSDTESLGGTVAIQTPSLRSELMNMLPLSTPLSHRSILQVLSGSMEVNTDQYFSSKEEADSFVKITKLDDQTITDKTRAKKLALYLTTHPTTGVVELKKLIKTTFLNRALLTVQDWLDVQKLFMDKFSADEDSTSTIFVARNSVVMAIDEILKEILIQNGYDIPKEIPPQPPSYQEISAQPLPPKTPRPDHLDLGTIPGSPPPPRIPPTTTVTVAPPPYSPQPPAQLPTLVPAQPAVPTQPSAVPAQPAVPTQPPVSAQVPPTGGPPPTPGPAQPQVISPPPPPPPPPPPAAQPAPIPPAAPTPAPAPVPGVPSAAQVAAAQQLLPRVKKRLTVEVEDIDAYLYLTNKLVALTTMF